MGSFLTGATGTGNSFAASAAPIIGQDFQNQINQSTGQFNDVYGNENNLAGILQQQMLSGQGPAPEQLETQQMNENAIKSNAGMIASQKGISPALAARMAAQNSAGMQQQAAGQGALQGMNRQLATQNALASLYGQQGNQAIGQNSTNQNALASYNNAQVGSTSNMNNTNQATSAQNAATAQKAVGGLLGGAASSLFAEGGVVQPAPQHFDAGGPVMANWGYSMHPMVDSGAAMANQYIQGGGQEKKEGSGYSDFSKGLVQSLNKPEMQTDAEAQQGYDDANAMLGSGAAQQMPAAEASQQFLTDTAATDAAASAGGDAGLLTGLTSMFAANGGQVPQPQKMAEGGDVMSSVAKLIPLALMALADGGEVPDHMQHMAQIYHPDFTNAKSMKTGGPVPGKPEVSGAKNTIKNDTVPAMLSPGEIVLPRSVTQSKDPVKAAADFVAEKLRSKKSSGNHSADFHDALSNAIKTRRAK